MKKKRKTMPKKAPTRKTQVKNAKGLFSRFSFSRIHFVVFGVLFAALAGMLLYRSFAATPNATEKMGVFRGSGRSELVPEYEKWLGRPVTYAVDFVGGNATPDDPWKSIDNPSWWCSQWASTQYMPSFSTAILPENTVTLEAGARGEYNAHWKRFGEVMVNRGCGDAVLRLGWEFNIKSFNWSIHPEKAGESGPANYAAYWRQIVNTLRTVPGQQFKFDWCPLAGAVPSPLTQAQVDAAYPGDAYVDIIGLDAYDGAKSGLTGEDRWQHQLNRPVGLLWQRNFAITHGKTISYPEWGLTVRPNDDLGGGDNPYYIQKMYDWMNALPASGGGSLKYHAYFEVDANDASHRLMLGQFPNSATVFKKLFGVAPNTTTPSDTTAPSAPTELVATVGGSTRVDLSWRPSSDNIGVAGYDIMRNGVKVTTVTGTSYSDSNLVASTAYTYTVKASDAAGNLSAQSNSITATTVAATTAPPPSSFVTLPFRMRSGSSTAYSDPAGLVWAPDQYYTVTGSNGTYSVANAIANTDKDPLYQRERWGISSYNIPIQNGTYVVRLHFAEINPTDRVFNVSAEGKSLLTDYDIETAVGSFAADIREFTVSVTDEQLNIGFTKLVNAPKISGIEVLVPQAPASTTTTKTFNGSLEKYGSATYSVTIPKAGTVRYALTNTTARYDIRVYDGSGKIVSEKLNTYAPLSGSFTAATAGTYKFKVTTKSWSARTHTFKVTYPN